MKLINAYNRYQKKLQTFINQQRRTPKEYPFVMYEEEKLLFKEYLNKSNNYLEFGLGGSTLFALINSDANIISVDTNQGWIGFIKKYRAIKDNLGKRLHIHYVDIGPTKYWGFPVDDTQRNKFPNFSSQIFSDKNLEKFDLVLIDGRFRVACALQTVQYFKNSSPVKIMIHDYSLREEYKIVEKYLDLVEFTKTLYV